MNTTFFLMELILKMESNFRPVRNVTVASAKRGK